MTATVGGCRRRSIARATPRARNRRRLCALDVLAVALLRLSDLAYFEADAMLRALEEAQAARERLVEMEPGNHVAHLLLGNIAMQQRRGDAARQLLRRSLGLNPNDPTVARMLSWAESNEGLAADAIVHAQEALLRTPLGRDRPAALWTLALAHWGRAVIRAPRCHTHAKRSPARRPSVSGMACSSHALRNWANSTKHGGCLRTPRRWPPAT